MGLQVQYQFLTLEKEKKSFLQEHSLEIDKKTIFVNLEIHSFDFETEAENIGSSLLEIVQKHIEEHSDQSLYNRLEEALKEINFFLTDLKNKKESDDIGKINAIVGVLEDNVLHLSKTGLAEGYLLRKGKVIEITEGLYNQKGNEKNYFENIATGDLESGDKVLFSSKRLLKFIGKTDLNSIFITSDIDGSFQELEGTLSYEETGDMLICGFVIEDLESQMIAVEKKGEGTKKMSQKNNDIFQKVTNFRKKVQQDLKDPTKRKNYIALGIIVIVAILLMNITMASNNKTNDEQLAKYQSVLQTAMDRLTDAQHQRLYDVKQAGESLKVAKEKALEVRESGVYYNDAVELLQAIEQEEEILDKRIHVENPIMLVDLGRKDSTTDALELIYFRDAFYTMTSNSILGPILDSSPDSYLKHTVDNGEIFVSGDRFIDRNDIVLFTKSNKVIEFQENSFSFMDTEDDIWKAGTEIQTYASRQFIYILSPEENNIWRYERTSQKYRGALSYNPDGVDITDAVSFAIDGGIYVLKQDGSVKRFYARKEVTFNIEGGPSVPLENIDSRAKIFTTDTLRNIYILDPGNERILVYKKVSFEDPTKMSYERQYVFRDTELRDMYIDNNEQNLYALTPQKILKVELK